MLNYVENKMMAEKMEKNIETAREQAIAMGKDQGTEINEVFAGIHAILEYKNMLMADTEMGLKYMRELAKLFVKELDMLESDYLKEELIKCIQLIQQAIRNMNECDYKKADKKMNLIYKKRYSC